MAIYKRGAVWWVEIQQHGTRIRQSAGRGTSRKEAKALETSIRARLKEDELRGKMGQRPRRTFGEALVRWLREEEPRLRDTTLKNKARQIRPHLEHVYLEDIPDAVGPLKAAVDRHGQPLKPATINRRLAIVRRILNLCHDWGWTAEPLGRRIKLLPENNARHIYLTPKEVHALADAAGEAEEAILLLAYTGLRLGELWSVREVQDNCLVVATSKNGKPRIVPLPEPVAHCAIPVTITRDQFRRAFETARLAIGKPDLHAHDLRHTYASLLIQSGAGPAVVRDLLGHSHLGVTSRYAHLSTDHLWDAVRKLSPHKNPHSEKRRKTANSRK